MSSRELRSTHDFLHTHLQEPELFWVHKWRVSPETHLIKVLAPTSLFYKEATCESSTKKGLLYAPENPKERENRTLRYWPQLSGITSTPFLCLQGRQFLKDMMSLGTDFEMHAIWQEYVEDPTARGSSIKIGQKKLLRMPFWKLDHVYIYYMTSPLQFCWKISLTAVVMRLTVGLWCFLLVTD